MDRKCFLMFGKCLINQMRTAGKGLVSYSVTVLANEIWLLVREIKASQLKMTQRLNFNIAVTRIKGAAFKAMS